jgi:hypothetical protein
MRFTSSHRSTTVFILIVCMFFMQENFAQKDTEYPKGFIMHTKLHNGMVTNFKSGADLYVGGIQLVPQFTVVENKMRAGVVAGVFYSGKALEGQFGVSTFVKLKTLKALVFGSAANVNLSAEHLWGTGKQKLIGGGINLELLNLLVLSLTTHRDYEYKTWWLQTSIGIRISKKKKMREPFNE